MNILLSTIESNNGIDSVSILIILLILFLFILTWGFNRISILRIRRKSEQAKDLSAIMKHTLNMSNNYVLRLSIRDHFAVNMHGNFLPKEGMDYEESLNYIHPDDRSIYVDYCTRLIVGEKTAQCILTAAGWKSAAATILPAKDRITHLKSSKIHMRFCR